MFKNNGSQRGSQQSSQGKTRGDSAPPPLPTYNNLQNCSCEKLKSGPKVGGGDAMAGITITFSRGYGFSSKLVSEFEKCPKGPIHPKFLGGGEREDAPIAF
jgi:hypothetical protein